jgi:hypothetical protein
MSGLTESGVAQTRELYERSKNAVQTMLESWHKSFGAAGQGAVAVNRKIFDIAERNISSSFDLAKDLAGAKNLPRQWNCKHCGSFDTYGFPPTFGTLVAPL